MLIKGNYDWCSLFKYLVVYNLRVGKWVKYEFYDVGKLIKYDYY